MIRGIGLRGAVAINVITMIGIGPLITIPLVLANLHGVTALAAWIAGAFIALCDGLAWAELGSLYPGSGGTYAYVREAFGAERWGRLAAFLFVWQIVLSAPLVLASGYIGFADYAAYLWPALGEDWIRQGLAAATVGVVTLVLLYRGIGIVGRIGIGLAGVATATLAAVIAASASRFEAGRAGAGDPHVAAGTMLAAGLGPALVITLYDYYGYGAACTIGDEVRAPARTLPWSVLLSIALVTALYVALQVGVLGAVPWHDLVAAKPGGAAPAAANFVAATVVERAWGEPAARVVTFAVLATAFASTFGNLLAYSRIPYAAARDGLFFSRFAQLHERGRFPYLALLAIGLLALPACFLPLGTVIAALTTGLVIVQSMAQLLAVVLLRRRNVRAPYRMWLYPVPALCAFAGWAYIFCSAGAQAIGFGLASLGAGLAAYAWRARLRADWPFGKALLALCALGGSLALCAGSAGATTWGHARTIERDGWPVFEVDGEPFFVYGAAFFYERLPRDRWDSSMAALADLGINTLDLYVPWNWHELADGDFDFDGRTNPRRDLDEVLRLARRHGFKIILRPGPVIRNEWRNAGYPAWLLSRPEYGMPLHDLLEGRYPPTATLQNAHSDDAAAQWMANATHVRYARRWLETVLRRCAPYGDLILAVALDDDQGAYLDNQTYPAPHFDAYLDWLRDVVHGVTGDRETVFINTYQMKVPASSPVWTMGNWYQSDAYALGEHDRAQLQFSTALLQTRPHQAMMASEFQAGWLEAADDIRPRPADPTNTMLAYATMLGAGVRGIVNFPAQDTLYPAGWEVPFANSFYAWDAALGFAGDPWPRAVPMAALGALVRTFGPDLAGARTRYDAAVLYLGGSLRPQASANENFADVASATIDAQQQCRNAGLSCALVDPSVLDDRTLRDYGMLVLPKLSDPHALVAALPERLRRLVSTGVGVISATAGARGLRDELSAEHRRPVVDGVLDASFARARSGRVDGFLTVANYADRPLEATHVTIDDGALHLRLPPVRVAAHTALIAPVGVTLERFGTASGRLIVSDCTPLAYRFQIGTVANFALPSFSRVGPAYATLGAGDPCSATVEEKTATYRYELDGLTNAVGRAGRAVATDAFAPATFFHPAPIMPLRADVDLGAHVTRAAAPGTALAYQADWYRDGAPVTILDNGVVRVAVSPQAGARAFFFQDDRDGRNCFTSVGALRDDVALEPPLSTSDRIAKYTHDFPAGTFNRPYATTLERATPPAGAPAQVAFAYDAPDVLPSGARFERTLSLEPAARAFTVDERVDFVNPETTGAQRAVSVSSFAVGSATTMQTERVLTPESAPFTALTTVHVTHGHALGFYDVDTHELATIAWRSGDVEDATILERRYSIVVRLTLAPGRVARTRYGNERAADERAAERLVSDADAAAQGVIPAARTR